MSYTTSNNSTKAFNLDDIQKAIEAVEPVPNGVDWMLVAPDGRAWKGNIQDLMPVFIAEHPMMKRTIFDRSVTLQFSED